MKSYNRVAVGLTLGMAAASLVSMPVQAKKKEQVQVGLSAAERNALATLKAAIDARDFTAAGSALSAAQSVVRSADGRYYMTVMQVEVARGTNNLSLLAPALETLIASGRVSQAELGTLYASQGAIAALAGERQRAEAAYARAFELAPSADLAISLAQVKISLNKIADAVMLIDRAIDLRAATGVPVPESWYRRGIVLATDAKLTPQVLKFNRGWIAAYPSPENWRDAVLTYRDFAKPDPATLVDAIRLARLAKGLEGERDYLEAAQTFSAAGIPGEAKSVFDEGVAGRFVDPAKASFKEAIVSASRDATAARPKLAALRSAAASAPAGSSASNAGDQLLSFGDYAGAIELYRLALQKGGADGDALNMRLGIALALSGRGPEAQTAFRTVTGPRAELAALWLIWLGQRS